MVRVEKITLEELEVGEQDIGEDPEYEIMDSIEGEEEDRVPDSDLRTVVRKELEQGKSRKSDESKKGDQMVETELPRKATTSAVETQQEAQAEVTLQEVGTK